MCPASGRVGRARAAGLGGDAKPTWSLDAHSRTLARALACGALVPGDVIVCGTPTGAGARFDPPIWLKPGDVVEVEAEGIGTLTNEIADEVL